MKRAWIVGLILGALSALRLSGEPSDGGSLIVTAHHGPVTRVVYSDADRSLYSIGEDGTARVWSPDEGKIRRSIRVSRLPLRMLAVHPSRPQFAVVESDGLDTFRLSIWDAERESHLFSVDLDEPPLFLTYSPSGRYLVYGRSQWDSLVFLDTRTWRQLPYLRSGSGIVSFAVVSRTEQNIMTYQPSGWITYLEISTGRVLKKDRTLSELNALAISPDNLYLAAAQGDDLVVVDLLSGAELARARLPGTTAISFSTPPAALPGSAPRGAEITCIAGNRLSRWYFNRTALYEMYLPPAEGFEQLTAIAQADSRVYLGNGNGSLLYLYPGFRFGVLARDNLMEVSDLAVADGVMALAGPEEVVRLSTAFLSREDPGRPEEPRRVVVPSPFGSARMEFAPDGTLYLWRRSEQEPGAFATLAPGAASFGPVNSGFASPLIQFDVDERGILTIEKSGECRMIDPGTSATMFQYRAPGMNRLIQAGPEILVGGKSSLSRFSSPLIRINRWTGETVSIPNTSSIIYDLLFNAREGWLYSLGVEQAGGRSRTLLKMHYGLGYTQERSIYQYEGEDLNASMAVESGDWNTTLYFTMGDEPVTAWNGYRFSQLEESSHIPRRLYVLGSLLFALNRDSTVTVWDTRSRAILLTLYLFRDHEWAALFADGREYTSPEGGRYLVPRPAAAEDPFRF